MAKAILMEVLMNSEKSRRKALSIAADAYGVIWVGVPEEEEGNRLMVIGNGVDAVRLANRLRKKVGYTRIVSISEYRLRFWN